MGIYQYTAVSATGETKSGQLEAASTNAAVEQLTRQALIPIRVREAQNAFDWRNQLEQLRHGSNRLNAAELLGFTRQLASLVRSGLTLERALAVSHQLALSRRQAAFSHEVLTRVRRGVSLAESLKASGVPLPGYYTSLVRAGEASGSLPESLARLTQLLEQSYETRERLLSAMVYPAILLLTIGLTLVLIVTFVLPRFEALFDEAGAKLPLATQIVMSIGRALRNYGWILPGAAALALGSLHRALAAPARRLRMDTLLLRQTWYRQTLAKADAARFARTLGILAAGGVPLPAGFRIAVTTLQNTALVHGANTALDGVNAGKDLADQLHRLGEFPPLLLQMVRVGLETGRLHETLIEAADILDDESRRAIERTVAIAVPMVTVLMGLLVAALIGSVLVGILSINDLAG